ncbi:NAD(P)-dependent oxidoreductase [bacterium]|nr:MAG: NAD(P)-dependent oxidoreductase [bacterium]
MIVSVRILLTGAGGNIAKGVVPKLLDLGHELVLSDVTRPEGLPQGTPFFQIDVQDGFGLDKAAEGCDLIVHTPAWHGIHWRSRTEIDFWRLNVQGTFWAFQAALANDIKRFVFLSSQAWHGHYDKYGFTKRVGEELCEYHQQSSGVSYVAVRPADLTPWGDDWLNRYGARLLYGGVDREDVLDSVVASVQYLSKERAEPVGTVLDAVRPNAFTAEQIAGWESDPSGTCEAIFPGSRELVERYGLNISRKPGLSGDTGWVEVGYAPTRHFGTFLEELRTLDEETVRSRICPY